MLMCYIHLHARVRAVCTYMQSSSCLCTVVPFVPTQGEGGVGAVVPKQSLFVPRARHGPPYAHVYSFAGMEMDMARLGKVCRAKVLGRNGYGYGLIRPGSPSTGA